MNIPLASQFTFRWMLLPETLNFYAHGKGRWQHCPKKTTASFSLRAGFGLGGNVEPVLVTVNDFQCADAAGAIK